MSWFIFEILPEIIIHLPYIIHRIAKDYLTDYNAHRNHMRELEQ